MATRYISQNTEFIVPLVTQEKEKQDSKGQSKSRLKANGDSTALRSNSIMQQAVSRVNDSGEATGSGRNSTAATVIPFDVSSDLKA